MLVRAVRVRVEAEQQFLTQLDHIDHTELTQLPCARLRLPSS